MGQLPATNLQDLYSPLAASCLLPPGLLPLASWPPASCPLAPASWRLLVGTATWPTSTRCTRLSSPHVNNKGKNNPSVRGFLDFVNSPTRAYAPWGCMRTCRQGNEVELTPTHGLLTVPLLRPTGVTALAGPTSCTTSRTPPTPQRGSARTFFCLPYETGNEAPAAATSISFGSPRVW